MTVKILQFIQRCRMVSSGDHVVCAVSGGKDSMALLHVLQQLQEPLGIHVTAAHFNHRLRGSESDRDEAFVREYCQRAGIPCCFGSEDVAAWADAHRLGLEEAARQLRYSFLLGIDPEARIATAHTADDNLETMLMHLIRGAGLHGLTGIPPVRDRVIRPLLETTAQELLTYLSQNQIPHVEDSTNQDAFCLRNRLRLQVLPLLKQENPALMKNSVEMLRLLRADDELLETAAADAISTACEGGLLQLETLRTMPEAIQPRALRSFLSPVPNLRAEHIRAAQQLCSSSCPSAVLQLPGSYVLRRRYAALELVKDTSESPPEPVRLIPGSSAAFGQWLIECSPAVPSHGRDPDALYLRLQPDGCYTLRTRCAGDRIRLPGGTKKLSRLMIDLKIPAVQRSLLPVLCHEDEVIALLPAAAAAGYRPDSTEGCYKLTVRKLED